MMGIRDQLRKTESDPDFSDDTGVLDYIEADSISKCKAIAAAVARKVQTILD